MSLSLPPNPTKKDLQKIQEYLTHHQGLQEKNNTIYQEKEQLLGSKLIIFKHKNKKQKNYYYRMYVGNRKYKIASLGTNNVIEARQLAYEEWHRLETHIAEKGDVFEKSNDEYLQDYLKYLDKQLELKNVIKSKKTVEAKKTSLKKLKTLLRPFKRPSDIKPDFLKNYVEWRQLADVKGGNWSKKHKTNPNPPTDNTMHKEICDFRGFFNYLKEENVTHKDINYPKIRLDLKRLAEKNVPFTDEDWRTLYQFMPTWIKKKYTITGEKKRLKLQQMGYSKEEIIQKIGLHKKGVKSHFYHKVFYNFFMILGNSGVRCSSALKLKWQNIRYETGRTLFNEDGTITKGEIAIISVPIDTKTGHRKVPTPTGKWFRDLWKLYADEYKKEGKTLKKSDYIFQNVGTDNSKGFEYFGKPLASSFLLRLFYELKDELRFYKDIEFTQNYTLHSLRSFYVNKRLELNVPVPVVARASGHSTATLLRHYENLNVLNFKDDLLKQKRIDLSKSGFIATDIEDTYQVDADL